MKWQKFIFLNAFETNLISFDRLTELSSTKVGEI